MSTHNQCLKEKIRKNVYPCKPKFYYIKVGGKGVYISLPCYHNVFFRRGQLDGDVLKSAIESVVKLVGRVAYTDINKRVLYAILVIATAWER